MVTNHTGSTNMGSSQKSRSPLVCIVGAGMTGICACKHLLQHGIRPVVLEAQSEIGGVWRQTFASTKLQTPRDSFQFSDYLWPPGTPVYPTHVDVKQYLHSYASKFGVLDCIRFKCKVLQIAQISGPRDELRPHLGNCLDAESVNKDCGWAICVQVDSSGNHLDADDNVNWLYFDFLILCIGRYGDIPKLPTYPPSKGPDVFRGKVLHSIEYANLDDNSVRSLVHNKRVVVVGMMKSALDLAMEASNANQGKNGHPCTMIFRSAHWMRPDNRTFSLIMSYLYATRFSELMIPKPEQGLLLSIISTFLTPMRWGISKFVEMFLLYSLPLRQFGLVPEETFFEQYASCQLPAIPESFFERVQEGHIKLCKTRNWGFFENGIVLEDGRQIEADVVILGTGYDGEKKLMSLLQKTEYTKLQNSEGGIPLYRGLIHPHIQNLAIMGFNEALSNLYASEMGARWLAHLLSGKFTLPSIEIMEKMSQKWNEYIKNATPFHQRSCIGAISIWYSDQVCHDLGWNPRRKRNIFQELFAPYSNMDYRD